MKKIKALGMPALLLLACLMAVGAMGQTGEAAITKEDIIGKAWKAMFGELHGPGHPLDLSRRIFS